MKSYLDDPKYKSLRIEFFNARKIIHGLDVYQTLIKKHLKNETDPDIKKEYRKELMENRKGPNGLRSLNKKIRAFYKYLKDNGITRW